MIEAFGGIAQCTQCVLMIVRVWCGDCVIWRVMVVEGAGCGRAHCTSRRAVLQRVCVDAHVGACTL